MEVYLPIQLEELLFSCQRVSFVITSVLNAVSMFCLLKKTPPNQMGVRSYLVYIQARVITASIYVDILFSPIPAFPAIAGYCVGLLCKAGISPHSLLGVLILQNVLILNAVMSCSIYRHQTIIPTNNSLRVSKQTRTAIQVVLLFAMGVTPIAYAAYPFERADVIGIIKENQFNITWIISRGSYFAQERGMAVLVVISLVELDIIIFIIVLLFLFWHMFHVLNAAKNKSPTSTKRVKDSLTVLFVQMAVPLAMVLITALLLITSLACECIPYDITLPAFCVLTLHPLVHNLILLSITPTYRRFIIATVRRQPMRIRASINSSHGNGT